MTTNRFWLSFANDDGNLGVCVVAVEGDEKTAVQKTQTLGINPGGEVLIIAIPESEKSELEHDRLYSREEMRENGYKAMMI